MSKISSPPTFAIEGIVITKVVKITFRYFAFCTNLNILHILNDLSKVVDAPKFKLEAFYMMMVTMVPTTTQKSNWFHPSLKYSLNPIAKSFMTASSVNIAANP